MTKAKDDLSRVRLIVDGKSEINELSKIEMEANDLKSSLSQIIEEQKKYEKESKNLDKIQARFDKLVEKARKLKEEGKQSSVTYQKNQKQIAKVAKQLRVAQDATEKLKDAQNRYNQESIRLDAAKFKMQDLRKEMGMAGMTLGQLVKHQKQLRNELTYSTVKGTAEYNKLRQKLLEVNGAIRQQRAELNGTKGFFAGMGKDMKAFGMMALGAVGVGSLSSKAWQKTDFLRQYGKLPNFDNAGVDHLTTNQAATRIRTLRIYISKAKKGILKDERVPEWEAEIKELEILIR